MAQTATETIGPAQCAAVIPCFNEAQRVGEVVRAVQRHVRTVFVVDDGSKDETSRVAAAARATVIRNDLNLGKGAALQRGLGRAWNEGFRWALTLDGDGQHSADDIPAFFQCVERTGAALVVGNRMHDPKRMPAVRRWVNRWLSGRLSVLAGIPVPDSQCGFRLINLSAWSGMQISRSHFEIESELLLAFVCAGYRVESVPIQVIYRAERSKINPLKDAARWFRWWAVARDQATRCPPLSGRAPCAPAAARAPRNKAEPQHS